MSKKILFVVPNHLNREILIPNIGFGYLATAVRNNTTYTIELMDALRLNLTNDDTAYAIIRSRPRIIGFQMMSRDAKNVSSICKIIKTLNSNLITVVGGPHPSGIPEFVLKNNPEIDFLIVGEGEIPFVKLLNELEKEKPDLSKVEGLGYRDENGSININKQYFEQSLERLGIPAWDIIDPRRYPQAPHGTFCMNLPSAPIFVTRGCPYLCTYCGGHLISGRKLRKRPIPNVMEEIELLVGRYGVKEIHIEDDNFTLDNEYVFNFCDELEKRKLKLSLALPNGVRLNSLTEELLKRMESVGFYSFAVGVETTSPRLLKLLNRSITIEEMTEKIMLVSRITHIKMTVFLLIGLPTETREEISSTLDFGLRMPFHKAALTPYIPLPGTPLFKQYLQREEIVLEDINFERMTSGDIIFSASNISKAELKDITKDFYRKFYFRPRILYGILREIKSFRHFAVVVNRARRMVS